LRRGAGLLEHGPHALLDALTAAAEHVLEELVLALEVVVDGALAQPGGIGDVLDARLGEAALGERGDRRIEHLPATVLALLVSGALCGPGVRRPRAQGTSSSSASGRGFASVTAVCGSGCGS